MHLFFSPHLDDAVLSCGGFIHQLTRRGEVVRIRTFMAGDPAVMPDTPLVRDLHHRWAVGESPVQARRAEDRAAAAVLSASVEHLPFPDCPYRTDAAGNPLYRVNNDLFGAVHPDDPVLAISIDLPENVEVVYAPLGAGGHVDHKIINQLARRITSVAVFFYEEYPYSANGGEAVRLTQDASVQQYGFQAVQTALAAFNDLLKSQLIALSEADLTAKIRAIDCYQSQLSTFWDDRDAMAVSVRQYAQEVGSAYPAERLWKE